MVIDGIDGVGKGVFLNEFVAEAKKDGKTVFEVNKFWEKNDFHPSLSEIGSADIIVTSEPTFAGIGRYIREELIAKNGRSYTPQSVAEAYALDRRILYEAVLLPALTAGIGVYQSRSLSSSIVYQRQSALDRGEDFSVDEIFAIPGNAFCYQHPMDFLLIPTINDAKEAIRRAEARDKDDNCEFENIDFQLKIKVHYESDEFRKVFEMAGIHVRYLDAGQSLEFSKKQAQDFYKNHLKLK